MPAQPLRRRLFDWFFYGHVYISLAAAALGWQSVYLSGRTAPAALYAFLFFATMGVYTLHRRMSFVRAGGQPDGRRYTVVRDHPTASLAVGVGSIFLSLGLSLRLPPSTFPPFLLALPFTFFYLIPLFPGGPRLRDLPYLKVVWVALAWTLMTDVLPQIVAGGWINHYETGFRFALTLGVALLFDTRDVILDRRQGVKTLAADHPNANMGLATTLFYCSAIVAVGVYSDPADDAVSICFIFGLWTCFSILQRKREEDFYAVWVNGLLLFSPLALRLWTII